MTKRMEGVEKLKKIFSSHVGKDCALTMRKVYESFYQEEPDTTTSAGKIKVYEKWKYIKQLFKVLRFNTQLFVIAEPTPKGWIFYIGENTDERDGFCGRLDKIVKGIKKTQKRCEEVVGSNLALVSVPIKKKKLGVPID